MKNKRKYLRLKEETAQGLAEYAVILSLICIVVIASLQLLGGTISDKLRGFDSSEESYVFRENIDVTSTDWISAFCSDGMVQSGEYPTEYMDGIMSWPIIESYNVLCFYKTGSSLEMNNLYGTGYGGYLYNPEDVSYYGTTFNHGWYYCEDFNYFPLSTFPVSAPTVTASSDFDEDFRALLQ